MRAVNHVHPGRALRDPGALHLGQAAAHRDLHALLLLRQQVTEVAVQPVGRVLPDRAGVEHHHVRGLAVVGGLVARLVEQARQALGIVRVHLAPVGADLVRPAACCHSDQDRGAGEGTERARLPRDLPTTGSGMISVCEWLQKRHLYGEWPSPIDGADVARRQVGLCVSRPSTAPGCGGRSRGPNEGGRVAIVCQGPDGISRDLLPMPWNARTRVHEYGGKSYLPVPGGFVFANFGDQRLYRCEVETAQSGQRAEPEPLTPAPNQDAADRFADFVLSPAGDEVWCVRERHRASRDGAPDGRADHPRDRGRPAGRFGRGRSRRDPGAGHRFGLLRLPDAVAGRHPAGLDLLESPADAVGRHRTPGRGARSATCRSATRASSS